MTAARTWRFSPSTRIALAFLVVVRFGFAALIFSLPFTLGGDRGADWTVVATGLVMAGFGVFAAFGFVAAMKTRVTLDGGTFDATVVSGHDALLVPRFRHVRLAVSDIRSVERRCEVFQSFGFSSMRDALSIVTLAGERIGLCSDTMGSAGTLPLDTVADAVAAAAGVVVTDDGTVRIRGSGLYGATSSTWTEAPLDNYRAARARRGAIVTLEACSLILLLTFALRACL
jgi:hypothetical protein